MKRSDDPTIQYDSRSARALAVVLLGASVPWLGAHGEPNAAQLVDAGNRYFEQNDFHAAAERYDQALRLAPENPLIWFAHGSAAFKRFEYGEALDAYSRALQFVGDDQARLESEIRYNLGVVKHHQAIGAMMTFQDALTPLQSALVHYRDSLALDPDRQDTRYNLELAHRLMIEITAQKVEEQNNPEARNQKTSDNQGQLSDQADKNAQSSDRQERDKASDDAQPGAQSQQAPQNAQSGQSNTTAPSESGPIDRELSADQADALVELTRQRAQANDAQRAQRRRARMLDTQEEKYW